MSNRSLFLLFLGNRPGQSAETVIHTLIGRIEKRIEKYKHMISKNTDYITRLDRLQLQEMSRHLESPMESSNASFTGFRFILKIYAKDWNSNNNL